jgi:hypothetical protein
MPPRRSSKKLAPKSKSSNQSLYRGGGFFLPPCFGLSSGSGGHLQIEPEEADYQSKN